MPALPPLEPWCPRCRRQAPLAASVPILCERHAREAWQQLARGGDRRSGRDRRHRQQLGAWTVRGDRRRRRRDRRRR
jgi:hypothetical protein